MGGECSIAAVSGAGGVGGHDPEMISGVRSQARNVRAEALITISSLDLVRRSASVANGSSILKLPRRAQSVGVYCPLSWVEWLIIKMAGVSDDDRTSSWGHSVR